MSKCSVQHLLSSFTFLLSFIEIWG
uniref:Uncharacterized protein n=1 Tax=Rhizophora mucronata TaxID=61149 RepID=A0A2P2R4T2_RHIMU